MNYRLPPASSDAQTWQGRAFGWHTTAFMAIAAAAMAAAGIGAAQLGQAATSTGVAALAMTAAVLCGFGMLHCLGDAIAAFLIIVRVDATSVNIRPGLIPFTTRRIRVADIATATAVAAPARPWAGWGWWLSSLPAQAALRSGPALALVLRDGRNITISVSNPQQAAALLHRMATAHTPRP